MKHMISIRILALVFFCSLLGGFVHQLVANELQVNINQADIKQLMQLKGIGEIKANKIIQSRKRFGFFKAPEELIERQVITEDLFLKIQNNIIVNNLGIIQNRTPDYTFKKIQPNNVEVLYDDQFYHRVVQLLAKARHSVYISSFIFKTSKNKHNHAVKMLKSIKQVANRGVPVSIILERSSYSQSLNKDNKITARSLDVPFIKVRFDKLNKTTHSKLFVIDQRYSIIGSHNLTHSALKLNNEVSILVDSPAIALDLIKYIQKL